MEGNIQCLLLNFSVSIELPYKQPIDLKQIHNKLGIVNTSIWEAEHADSYKFETNLGKSENPSKIMHSSIQQTSVVVASHSLLLSFPSPQTPQHPVLTLGSSLPPW